MTSLLCQLEKLTTLDVGGTRVTDAGLVWLKNCRRLKELRLGHTSVTDAGVRLLHGLANLEILGLHATRVTAQGIADLRKAWPKCKILWDGP